MSCYHVNEIHSISSQLHYWLYLLRAENKSMESQFQDKSLAMPDSLDRASNERMENVNITRYKQNLQKIENIKNAIERIKYNDLGLCTLCGEYIGTKRILAMPDTTLCVQCKIDYMDDA